MFRMRKHGARSVGEISKMLNISKPAASQLLDKLVQTGYLFREESKIDRPIKLHNLTSKGEECTQIFFDKIKEYNKELVDFCAPEEHELMTSLLIKLTDKLQGLPTKEHPKEGKCLN